MRLSATLGLVVTVVVSVLAVASAEAAGKVGYSDIDTAALAVLVDKGVKVVDIRRADEWRDTGVIPGSTLITAFDAQGRFNAHFPTQFGSLVGSDEEVVIICRSGNRSSALSRVLSDRAGFTRVYNASGGIRSWIDGGNRTVPCATC